MQTLVKHPAPPRRATAYLQKLLETTDPEQVSEDSKTLRVFNVYGYKATSGTTNTANTGNVYLGWSEDSQPILLSPGESQALVIKGDPGESKNLKDLWIRGAVGDGVFCEYDDALISD